MNQTAENAIRPRSSGASYTPRTPRMRQRQRFDLTTRLEEDEDIDNLGLAGIMHMLRYKIKITVKLYAVYL